MKKGLCLLIVLIVFGCTPYIFAWGYGDRQVGLWIAENQEKLRAKNERVKLIGKQEFLNNNFPSVAKQIHKKIQEGDYAGAIELADELAKTLQYGYDGEPYLDGEKLFGINEMIGMALQD